MNNTLSPCIVVESQKGRSWAGEKTQAPAESSAAAAGKAVRKTKARHNTTRGSTSIRQFDIKLSFQALGRDVLDPPRAHARRPTALAYRFSFR
jgi:hypothetical protein